jgi:hypothetical protein
MNLNLQLQPMVDRLRFTLLAAGWPGIAGLLLLLVGAGLLLVMPQQWAAVEAAKDTAERRHQEYLRATEGGGSGGTGAGESLTRFRELLPAETQADEAMEIIQRDAQKHGLVLTGTDYKWLRQPNEKLAQVRIAMPVKADYPQLRAFVKDVLVDVPGLALEQFDLQRDNIGSASIDARLRFALFLKAGA